MVVDVTTSMDCILAHVNCIQQYIIKLCHTTDYQFTSSCKFTWTCPLRLTAMTTYCKGCQMY